MAAVNTAALSPRSFLHVIAYVCIFYSFFATRHLWRGRSDGHSLSLGWEIDGMRKAQTGPKPDEPRLDVDIFEVLAIVITVTRCEGSLPSLPLTPPCEQPAPSETSSSSPRPLHRHFVTVFVVKPSCRSWPNQAISRLCSRCEEASIVLLFLTHEICQHDDYVRNSAQTIMHELNFVLQIGWSGFTGVGYPKRVPAVSLGKNSGFTYF